MITVLYFGWVREGIGMDEERIEDAPATVAELLPVLAERSPAHAEALRVPARLRFAINQEIAPDDAQIPPGAEVAIFPPVTGG
ncbi:MAG: molybdopterin converting factor subunit 1 [Sphingomonadaceae bacterium]|nr:molybdopterin converting factor subunit 1 [Sphingomonadaceae bacterium]